MLSQPPCYWKGATELKENAGQKKSQQQAGLLVQKSRAADLMLKRLKTGTFMPMMPVRQHHTLYASALFFASTPVIKQLRRKPSIPDPYRLDGSCPAPIF